jgi:uncharacterized protein
MLFNVAQLLKETTGAIRRYVLNEDLTGLDEELKFLAPLSGTLQMLRTNSGILVSGDLQTTVEVGCGRCLEPVAVNVEFWLEESFRPLLEVNTGRYIPPSEFEGTQDDLEDAALMIDEHHILNIAEVVRQAVWLALPMYPSCTWMGTGECPNLRRRRAELGDLADVEVYTDLEGPHQDQEVDPRWAALLKLRNDRNGAERS